MNLFGIAVSEAEIRLLGIAGALTMLLLGVYVPAAIKRRQNAEAAFVNAFDGVLLNLRENPDRPMAQIAFSFHNEILAAIDVYRKDVPCWRRKGFERVVEKYKQAKDTASFHGSVFAVGLSEKTDIAKANRKLYHEAINDLLSHAKFP